MAACHADSTCWRRRTVTERKRAAVSSLDRDYDLTRRLRAGSSSRYACSDVFNLLDDGGCVARSERRDATLCEETVDVRSDGTAFVRWTYTDFAYTVDGAQSEEDEAIPSSGSIVFEGNPEDRGSYVPPVGSFGLSVSSAAAWMTAELVIHTRAFAIMATRTHGGIDRLRRLGDHAPMPWSQASHRVVYGELLDARINRGESTLRFDGVTLWHRREAALLSYHTPYDLNFSTTGLGPAHVEVVGHLWVALVSGELLGGEARQSNYIASVPRPDGTAGPMNHRFETSIELLDD
jgi:hypothetical protein